MKCPGCGYVSFERLESCKRCGAPLVATATAPADAPIGPADNLQGLRLESGRRVPDGSRGRPTRGIPADQFVEMLAEGATGTGEEEFATLPPTSSDSAEIAETADLDDDDGPPFRIDDDLFEGQFPAVPEVPDSAATTREMDDRAGSWYASARSLPGPMFDLRDDDPDTEIGGEPIIDRDDEVPERFWAPEVAGLGRRAVALLVDQALLAAILGLFFLGALLALRLSGFDTDYFLAAAGLRASLSPFALLGALLSLVYHVCFHGTTGRTPGKKLAGVEVRTNAGVVPSWGRAIVRWFGAAFGLVCVGAGLVWAIFDRRHRGWADLLSGTLITRQRRESAGGFASLIVTAGKD